MAASGNNDPSGERKIVAGALFEKSHSLKWRQSGGEMIGHSTFLRQSVYPNIGSALRKGCGVLLATAVLIITAPLITTTPREEFLPPPASTAGSNEESRIAVKLRHGDTLMAVLKRFGIARPSAHALVAQVRPLMNLRQIRPGDDVHVVLNAADQTVESVELVGDDSIVRVKATDEGWTAEREAIPFVREKRVIRGTIQGSLYESGIEAGLSPQHILDLAKMFESEIDFFSDFHPKDGFQILLEELRYANGKRAAGRVLAAELEAAGELFDGFHFGSGEAGEYYTGKGESLRRAFLRAPLSFARISSPFNRNRMHPIFRTVRPHLAIDYAAPAGTPVVSIGRGKIEYIGRRGGYGNVIDIRHSDNYISRYAHFSRFEPKLKRGDSVNAGDVIGYVGQTGHATGPHLHFEFLRGATKVNFLALRLPKTQQLTGADLARFQRLRDERRALLRGEEPKLVENTRHGL
jgi:murein DD-endopeptidase MepM/ murein hydrolase activator NlpD